MATVLERPAPYTGRFRLYALVFVGLVMAGFALAQSARVPRPTLGSRSQQTPIAVESGNAERTGALAVADTLAALGTDVWPFRLNGLIHARITVEVADPAQIECRLLDPEGRVLKLPRMVRDNCRFAWTPARTGAYRLEIENLTGGELPYAVRTRQLGSN